MTRPPTDASTPTPMQRDGAVTIQGSIPGSMIKEWAAASKTMD